MLELIFTPILGITIVVLAIVWLEKEISIGMNLNMLILLGILQTLAYTYIFWNIISH